MPMMLQAAITFSFPAPRFLEQFVALRPGVHPDFRNPLALELVQQTARHIRLHVDSRHVDVARNVEHRRIGRNAFHLAFVGIDRNHAVPLGLESAQRLVAELRPVARRADHCHSFHTLIIASGTSAERQIAGCTLHASDGVLVHEPFVPVRSNRHAQHDHDCGRRRPARRIWHSRRSTPRIGPAPSRRAFWTRRSCTSTSCLRSRASPSVPSPPQTPTSPRARRKTRRRKCRSTRRPCWPRDSPRSSRSLARSREVSLSMRWHGSGDTLLVEGKFVEMDPGSRAKRYLVGFGAGKSGVTVEGSVKAPDGMLLATFKQRRIGVMGAAGGDSMGKLGQRHERHRRGHRQVPRARGPKGQKLDD